MQNTSTPITIDELKDLMSFKAWLRKVLLPTWKKLIRDLRTRLQSFERVKNNES